MTFLNLLINPFFYNLFFFFHRYKNLSVKYYQENKERLQKKARERYQNLSKEETEKKPEYGRERYKNFSEDEKLSIEKIL